MKIEVKQRYDTFDMTGVVAVITEEQWAKYCEFDRQRTKELLTEVE